MWVLLQRKIANVNLAECAETKTVGMCPSEKPKSTFSFLDNSKAPEPIRIQSTVKKKRAL